MKNLMILGANILQLPLIEQAKKSGYRAVVVSPQKDEPGFKLADHSVHADVRDEQTVLEYAREYDICGIITDQTDIPVRTAAYVAEKMGLPGIGYETACLFTDKYLMREKCRELGIKTLEYKKTGSLFEALEFWEEHSSPVIIKPVDNQGSKGVMKAETKIELKEKFNEALSYSKAGYALVEEFVYGREFVVEAITYDYSFKNLICGDTHYFDIPDVFSATTRIFPSTVKEELQKRVLFLNEKIITGFGLKQGISHSEFIMKGDEIYLLETAARGGGVFISSDLISISTGLNTEKFLIEIATGTLKEFPEIRNTGFVCCYVSFFLPEGTVEVVEGTDKVKKMSFTHRTSLDSIKIGMKTKPIRDKTARHFVIISASSHDELARQVETIKNTLKIRVLTDNGIKGPIWS